MIQVPSQLPKAEYKIRIEGNLGNSRGGSIFASETPLKFSEKFLSILIQVCAVHNVMHADAFICM
jgi:hypothetical protein